MLGGARGVGVSIYILNGRTIIVGEFYIETKRLVITEFDESMIKCVHQNSLDSDTRRFVPDEVFETVEDATKIVLFLMNCYKGNTGPFVYPVLIKDSENIGCVQAVPIKDEWEIGYHIAKTHTGNGYATEAVSAFLPQIMKQLGISKIWGICRGDNIASRKVLEKCSIILQKNITYYQGKQHEVCKYLYSVV